jgi:hypothetical protein
MAIPGVESTVGGAPAQLSSNLFYEAQQFKVNAEKYRKAINKPSLKAYFVVVPYRMVDVITGEPSEELVEKLRTELTKK